MPQTNAEKRRATRVLLNVPALVESIGMPSPQLHDNLAAVYERITPADERVGSKFPGVVRDLSTNGAFVAGDPLPLLSRVAIAFTIEGHGQIEALGWVLWRRSGDCQIPRDDGSQVKLPRGFGILFESIPLDARLAINKMVSNIDKN